VAQPVHKSNSGYDSAAGKGNSGGEQLMASLKPMLLLPLRKRSVVTVLQFPMS
jgi:hypothetical protein